MFILGYGWASKFYFNSKTRLSTAKLIRKNTTVTRTFWDFWEAECSSLSIGRYQKMKLKFHHFFFWLQQTQIETFIYFKQSGNITQTFISIINLSTLSITGCLKQNNYPGLPCTFLHLPAVLAQLLFPCAIQEERYIQEVYDHKSNGFPSKVTLWLRSEVHSDSEFLFFFFFFFFRPGSL